MGYLLIIKSLNTQKGDRDRILLVVSLLSFSPFLHCLSLGEGGRVCWVLGSLKVPICVLVSEPYGAERPKWSSSSWDAPCRLSHQSLRYPLFKIRGHTFVLLNPFSPNSDPLSSCLSPAEEENWNEMNFHASLLKLQSLIPKQQCLTWHHKFAILLKVLYTYSSMIWK
jgi:hypothetical protein